LTCLVVLFAALRVLPVLLHHGCAGERPLGVYALYDERHNLQYVGYSRNMVLAVKVRGRGRGRGGWGGGVCNPGGGGWSWVGRSKVKGGVVIKMGKGSCRVQGHPHMPCSTNVIMIMYTSLMPLAPPSPAGSPGVYG
jgi:hypothetical protein